MYKEQLTDAQAEAARALAQLRGSREENAVLRAQQQEGLLAAQHRQRQEDKNMWVLKKMLNTSMSANFQAPVPAPFLAKASCS